MHENRETSGAPRPERGTRPVREGVKPHGGRARFGGVGPRHTIDEPGEQGRAIFGGAWGEKGAGQGEHCSSQHQPDTVRGLSVPWIERCARSIRQSSKVGAVWCSEASRWPSGWKSRRCRFPSWHCSDIRRRSGWPNRRKPGSKRPRWLDANLVSSDRRASKATGRSKTNCS